MNAMTQENLFIGRCGTKALVKSNCETIGVECPKCKKTHDFLMCCGPRGEKYSD